MTLGKAGQSRQGGAGTSDASQNGAETWQRLGIWQGTLPRAADGAEGMRLHPTAPSAAAGSGNGAVAEPEQPRAPLLGGTAGISTPGMSLGGLGAAPRGCTSGSTSGWGGSSSTAEGTARCPGTTKTGGIGNLGAGRDPQGSFPAAVSPSWDEGVKIQGLSGVEAMDGQRGGDKGHKGTRHKKPLCVCLC